MGKPEFDCQRCKWIWTRCWAILSVKRAQQYMSPKNAFVSRFVGGLKMTRLPTSRGFKKRGKVKKQNEIKKQLRVLSYLHDTIKYKTTLKIFNIELWNPPPIQQQYQAEILEVFYPISRHHWTVPTPRDTWQKTSYFAFSTEHKHSNSDLSF